MHIIIRGEFVLVFCQTLDFSLFHQKLYGMSFLSAVSGSPGVYILEKPDELLSVSSDTVARKSQ